MANAHRLHYPQVRSERRLHGRIERTEHQRLLVTRNMTDRRRDSAGHRLYPNARPAHEVARDRALTEGEGAVVCHGVREAAADVDDVCRAAVARVRISDRDRTPGEAARAVP